MSTPCNPRAILAQVAITALIKEMFATFAAHRARRRACTCAACPSCPRAAAVTPEVTP